MKSKDLVILLPLFLGVISLVLAFKMQEKHKWFQLTLFSVGAFCLLGVSIYRIYDLIKYRKLDDIIEQYEQESEIQEKNMNINMNIIPY
jgi:hypothetical protein